MAAFTSGFWQVLVAAVPTIFSSMEASIWQRALGDSLAVLGGTGGIIFQVLTFGVAMLIAWQKQGGGEVKKIFTSNLFAAAAIVGAWLLTLLAHYAVISPRALLKEKQAVIESRKDLRVSITNAEYSPGAGVIKVSVAFLNNGSVTRQVLGHQFLLQRDLLAYSMFSENIADSETKIAPLGTETATYEQKLSPYDLVDKGKAYVNLYIKFLSTDGKMKLKTIDNVMWIQSTKDGISVGSNRFEDISLDEGAPPLLFAPISLTPPSQSP